MERFCRKENSGITLIALVVTIIVLLILAGIAIVQLQNNGLIGKTQDAKDESKKSQYIEELNLDIMAEKMKWANLYNNEDIKISSREGTSEEENKIFITSLNNRIIQNHQDTWLSESIVYFENQSGDEDENAEASTCNRIRVETKDNYLLTITVNNDEKTAAVDEDSFETLSYSRYKVKYNPNGATGTEYYQKFSCGKTQNLKTNEFARVGFNFLGWSKDSNATTATYTDGQAITEDLTTTNGETVNLYAIWDEINYYAEWKGTRNTKGTGQAPLIQSDGVTVSGNTITITVAGNYKIDIAWKTSGVTPTAHQLYIKKNNTTICNRRATGGKVAKSTVNFDLAVGDVIKVEQYTDNGSYATWCDVLLYKTTPPVTVGI